MAERRYSKTHEWVAVDGKSATVGIVNENLTAHPELVNSDPYGEGWILKVDLAGAPPSDLMDEADYKKAAEAGAH